jgi:hypothetical protein
MNLIIRWRKNEREKSYDKILPLGFADGASAPSHWFARKACDGSIPNALSGAAADASR